MKRLFLISAVTLGLMLSFTGPVSAGKPHIQTFADLQVPPDDPTEAARVRIWFPIQRHSNCRVRVEVLDSSGTVIRHLLSRLMSDGYYNIYWDRRDDSGRFVPPGVYPVRINDCGTIRDATVEAAYRLYENTTTLGVTQDSSGALINLALPEDSLAVAFHLKMVSAKDDGRPFLDTVLNAGPHRLPIRLAKDVVGGRYMIALIINGGFVKETEFVYRP